MTRSKQTAAPLIPANSSPQKLREVAAGCKACALWEHATQTVFGEGSTHAHVMLVGEQRGDKEDVQGRPFVGPAGAVLNKALAAAGIDRNDVYMTNIVKHFKWEPQGKRRLHKKPNAIEISACRPWLDAEIRAVKPQVVVLLGATAAQSIMGSQFKLTQHRGKVLQTPGPVGPGLPIERVVATIHPSAVLRAPDSEGRRAAYEALVADLKVVARALRSGT